MLNLIQHIKNKAYYSMASIKNRYPCKLIKIKNIGARNKNAYITYQAVTKLNIRDAKLTDILDDKMLTEKFHPMDCVRLGFLAAGEILLKDTSDLNEAQKKYQKIANHLFEDIQVSS